MAIEHFSISQLAVLQRSKNAELRGLLGLDMLNVKVKSMDIDETSQDRTPKELLLLCYIVRTRAA